MFTRVNNWIDTTLEGMNLSRRDLDFRFKFRGHKYRYPTFHPIWWIIRIAEIIFATYALYAWCFIMIVLFG